MKRPTLSPKRASLCAVFFVGILIACSGEEQGPGSGGAGGSGAAAPASGGAPPGTGGSPGSGGAPATHAGGGTSSGGSVAAGGGATGGSAAGGQQSAGGGANLPGYFVAPDGSDDNPGTESAPFKTLEKARQRIDAENDAMQEDLHVYLRGGTHRLDETVTFRPSDSGSGGHRVHYEAYPGETPVLMGSVPVTGWTLHSGNIYKAPLERTKKLRNLYVNGARATMASKRVTSQGASGTYSVTQGQADWAWTSGTAADGVRYSLNDVPEIAANRDDLEIVNGTTWNENIVCTRDVTTSGGSRVLLLQQPYGAIAQQPGWGSGFNPSGTHTLFNALEFLTQPGQFYFDKTEQTLYYWPRSGEDMATAEVEAPFLETLIAIVGTSTTERVNNLTFRGLRLENTDYSLHRTADSWGKASVQAATVFTAFLAGGDWHSTKYEILDTFPGVVLMNSAESIEITNSVVAHSGSEGISMINDVSNSVITGNLITDIAGSGITIGHPQHVYIGDGGARAKYSSGVEAACKDITIENNVLYNISTLPGFGGHSGVTAFYPDGVKIEHNHIELTAYNGISLGWGWRNFKDSTTCRDSSVSYNRFIDTLSRLHDSGAVYTIGQMPGTTINKNYVRGIPPATSGPTYGLHNDEGTAYIVENDNVLDIDPGVTYTINCEDFGEKHNLTILRTYATVNKMGINPPSSRIDPPVVVSDNVWPLEQYTTCVESGVESSYQHVLPEALVSLANRALPASGAARASDASLPIRPTGEAYEVWLAPAGTTTFAEGPTMTRALGTATSIAIPSQTGNYHLHVLASGGQKLEESAALVRVQP